MANSNGMQTPVEKAPLVNLHFDEVKESLQYEMLRAKDALSRAASQAEKSAKANPRATAALLVGVGAALGAVLFAVLRPKPSASEVVIRALKDSANRTGRTISSGWNSARRAIR